MISDLSIILYQAKRRIIISINESGLTPELADLVLSSVLSDIRDQECFELVKKYQGLDTNIDNYKFDEEVKTDG